MDRKMKPSEMVEAVLRGHKPGAVVENAVGLAMITPSATLVTRQPTRAELEAAEFKRMQARGRQARQEGEPLVDMGHGGGQDSYDPSMVAADAAPDGSDYAGAKHIDGLSDVGGGALQDPSDMNSRRGRGRGRHENDMPWDDDEDDDGEMASDEDRIIDQMVRREMHDDVDGGHKYNGDEDDDEDDDIGYEGRRRRKEGRRRRRARV